MILMLQNGDYVTDGTATFIVVDMLDSTPCGSVVYDNYVRPRTVKCNGATVNRSDYPRLVTWADSNSQWTNDTTNDIGKIGVGNGSTTMVLPNLIGRFIEGADTGGGKMEAGLPNAYMVAIMHNSLAGTGLASVTGNCVQVDTIASGYDSGNVLSSAPSIGVFTFNLAYASTIYGNSTTVQPPSVKRIPLIYF